MLSICQHPVRITRYIRLKTWRKFWSQGMCSSPLSANACFCEQCSQCCLRIIYTFLSAVGFLMSNKVTVLAKSFPAVEVSNISVSLKCLWMSTMICRFSGVQKTAEFLHYHFPQSFAFFLFFFFLHIRASAFQDPYRNMSTLKLLMPSWFIPKN